MNATVLAAALMAQASSSGGAASEALDEAAPPPVSQVALDFLAQLPASFEGWEPEGFEGQAVSQDLAMLGREDLVQRLNPGAYTYRPCPVLEGDALQTAVQAARDAQIVIINEAHNQPLHRHVITRLGLELSDRFDVFAAETLNYLRLMDPREPGPLGWYDREPVFARQIASLENAGYELVAYEIRAHQRDPDAEGFAARVNVREEAQANNLIAEVLEDDPEARILIHVGYSHVLEAPVTVDEDEPELRWFASRLKEKTGIDPLTISQTHCSPAAPPSGEAGEAAVAGLGAAPGAVMLVDGSDAAPEGTVDLFFAHAPMSFTDLRPDWRREAGDVDVAIPASLLPTEAPVIIEARAPEDTLAHTPADRLLVYPGEAPVLLLRPGEYVITAWNADGAAGDAVAVSVN
jgi:hypothetical protein